MTFVAWVKDYRANHFNKEKWWSPRATPPGDVGEPKYEIVGKYDNMEEAESLLYLQEEDLQFHLGISRYKWDGEIQRGISTDLCLRSV